MRKMIAALALACAFVVPARAETVNSIGLDIRTVYADFYTYPSIYTYDTFNLVGLKGEQTRSFRQLDKTTLAFGGSLAGYLVDYESEYLSVIEKGSGYGAVDLSAFLQANYAVDSQFDVLGRFGSSYLYILAKDGAETPHDDDFEETFFDLFAALGVRYRLNGPAKRSVSWMYRFAITELSITADYFDVGNTQEFRDEYTNNYFVVSYDF